MVPIRVGFILKALTQKENSYTSNKTGADGWQFGCRCWPSTLKLLILQMDFPLAEPDFHCCVTLQEVCLCVCVLLSWALCVIVYRRVHLVAMKTHYNAVPSFPLPPALSPIFPPSAVIWKPSRPSIVIS